MPIIARDRIQLRNRTFMRSRALWAKNSYGDPDYAFIASIAVILLLGLGLLSSATSVLSLDITNGQRAYVFVVQQVLHGVLPGVLIFFIAYHIDYRVYRSFAPLCAAVSLILPLLPFIPSFGVVENGVHSWVRAFGFTIQTSEIAKCTFILWLS